MSMWLSFVPVCLRVQANGGFLGDAALCCHGNNAAIRLHETPVVLSVCAHGGKMPSMC